ncbi:MAG: PAS domain-containing protein [Candidatus Eisenbacteria bacterium]|nr:PAS domain-containing protein [Candidatus Eisenbacteria bacterium]
MLETARTLSHDDALQLLHHLDGGLIYLDRELHIVFMNRQAEEICDADAADFHGKSLFDLLVPLDRTWLGPEDPCWEVFSFPPAELQVKRDDRELSLEARLIPLEKNGDLQGGLFLFEDASESAGEREFQRNVDRFSSIGELSAIIAHEMRNPLTGIRTTVQYVGAKLGEDELRQDLEDAISELDRIEQFTTDLLQFARPKTSTMEAYSLNEVVESCLDNLSLQCEQKSVQVKRDLAEQLPQIPLDPDAMQQAFLNIMLNAIEAISDEGGVIRVTTSSRRYRTRQAVEVAFSDTGCGIDPEHMDKIFDPFFTSKGASGTGLGLSITLQIIKEHSGRIYVRNRAQGGVTFRVSLPVPAPAPAETSRGESDG